MFGRLFQSSLGQPLLTSDGLFELFPLHLTLRCRADLQALQLLPQEAVAVELQAVGLSGSSHVDSRTRVLETRVLGSWTMQV